jgi:hypothetical protein
VTVKDAFDRWWEWVGRPPGSDLHSGLDWRLDHDFNAAEEALADDGLNAVFNQAIGSGYAIVER